MEKQRRLPRRELPNIRAQFVRMLDVELPAKSIMVALKLSRSTFFALHGTSIHQLMSYSSLVGPFPRKSPMARGPARRR